MSLLSVTNLPPKWVVSPRDRQAEAKLQQELGVPTLVAALLAQRGYTDPESASRFLKPTTDQFYDPKLLPDYRQAADAILAAKENGDLIFVHGDYDVDGVTSAAILSRFLKAIGCQVHTHVPHRMKEGYGIHLNAVAQAESMGAKLFLTCDCGIGAHEQVDSAHAAGMKVVVTDHHTVGDILPNAEAVVNPHRPDSEYPFSELSGAGVAFKLCEGISAELGLSPDNFYRAFLDLAALGTIADVMPLVDENRIIAKYGLERLADTKKVGLIALMREANVVPEPGKPLKARNVGWHLGPRLNAAGRLDDSAVALKLLLEADPTAADELAKELEAVNTLRRSETMKVVDEALQQAERDGCDQDFVIIVAEAGWHPGIVGIAAGRLVERFYRPCFVMSVNTETGICKGSGRSIRNFNLADAIKNHPRLFLTGGGHAMAAGCSFEYKNLTEVRRVLHDYAASVLTEEDLRPSIYADMEVEAEEVTLASTEAIAALEPFGSENPEPLFMTRDLMITQIMPTKNPSHARLLLRKEDGPTITAIAFGLGERLQQTGVGTKVDVLFSPNADEFRGQRNLTWQIKDFTVSA